MPLTYCKTTKTDCVRFFALSSAQFFGQGEKKVSVCWEKNGEVFEKDEYLETVLSWSFEPDISGV